MIKNRTPKITKALAILRDDFGIDPDRVRRSYHCQSKRIYKVLQKHGYTWTGSAWQRKPLPLYLIACKHA